MNVTDGLELYGSKVLLRPYIRDYVPKYHSWMEDEELRAQTGSERLSLEEEYAMQEEWVKDPLKATFIVFDRSKVEGGEDGMVGDVNLFFERKEDDGEGGGGVTEEKVVRGEEAEISLMIAEKEARGKGFGREALQLMLRFAAYLGCTQVTAKITDSNLPSLALFRSAGFDKEKAIPAFEEIHLSTSISPSTADTTDEWMRKLDVMPSAGGGE